MSQYLSKTDIRELLDKVDTHSISEGTTLHTHHCKEGEGNDRCYVSKKEGTILIYCHHCQGKAVIREKYGEVKKHTSTFIANPVRYSNTLPHDIEYDVSKWHIDAKMWIAQGNVGWELAKQYEMGYSAYLHRVIIPIIWKGRYVGYTARRLHNDKSAKYLTRYKKEDKEDFIFKATASVHNPTCILVEDMLSAMRLGDVGVDAYALQGTYLPVAITSDVLYNRYKEVYVWLDNDNAEVLSNRIKIVNKLRLYIPTVKVVEDVVDPKALSNTEIKHTLSKAR